LKTADFEPVLAEPMETPTASATVPAIARKDRGSFQFFIFSSLRARVAFATIGRRERGA